MTIDCPHVFVAVVVVQSILEFYLGRTNKIKSSSTVELIYNILKVIVTKQKGV